jgi:hypothetical protein
MTGDVFAVVFLNDSQTLFTTQREGPIKIWNYNTGKLIKSISV